MLLKKLLGGKVNKLPTNPYAAGNAVTGDKFFDRDDIVNSVKELLSSDTGNLLVLHGQRRIGKTSVLMQIEEKYLDILGDNVVVSYIDFSGHTTNFEAMLTELAKKIDCKKCKTLKFNQSNQLDDFVDWLNDLFSEDDKKYLLLFDEFDAYHQNEDKVDEKDEKVDDWEMVFRFVKKLAELNIQRLNIVFVIGRHVDDFIRANALFKAAKNHHVDTFVKNDFEKLVLQSKDFLFWDKKIINYIFTLTNGHPYITQALCKELFLKYHNHHTTYPLKLPIITRSDIDDLCDKTTSVSSSITSGMGWIWDGLKPAMRVVASAFAELSETDPKKYISHGKLIDHLKKAGVNEIIDELEFAPKDLLKTALIEGNKKLGYRFKVELIRRWIRNTKPLKEILLVELKRISIESLDFYKQGTKDLESKNFAQAIEAFKSAKKINPNYVEAIIGLSHALEQNGEWEKAKEELDVLYVNEKFPDQAKESLINLLLRKIEKREVGDAERVKLYDEILRIEPEHNKAIDGRNGILRRWAKEAEEDGEYHEAANYYEKMNDIQNYRKFRNKHLWNKYIAKNALGIISGIVGLLVGIAFFSWDGEPKIIWFFMILISGAGISYLIGKFLMRSRKRKPNSF
jgi:hypothetical protein